MVAIHYVRILLTEVKTLLLSIFRQAQARDRLIRAQPSLATAFGQNSQIDSESTIGAFSTIGQNSSIKQSDISHNVKLWHNVSVEHTSIQNYVSIGPDCTIDSTNISSFTYLGKECWLKKVNIGKYCSIAQNFTCGPGNHPTHMISTSPVFYFRYPVCGMSFSNEDAVKESYTSIVGHDVWIGANVFVKSGVTIGNGAIVAAGAMVMKDVAPYSIVGGVPAKEIRKRYAAEDIELLEAIQWWNWPEEYLREAVPLIQKGNVKALAEWYAERKLNQ